MDMMEKFLKHVGLLLCLLFVGFKSFAVSEGNETCRFGHMQCDITKKCVPFSWRCDNEHDCGQNDVSDEKNCPQKTCAEHEYNCGANCIPYKWTCDGESDCDNAEDEGEQLCAKSQGCNMEEFVCGEGSCINKQWVCDGVEDCENGKDEQMCVKTCEGDMFTCENSDCISMSWKCDGDHDCIDKSDEQSCDEKVCSMEEFKCADSTRCIDMKWKCDGDFDCADHSDESHNCSHSSGHLDSCASMTEFKCKTSGECIHVSWQCDGDSDCTDGSDEGSPECKYECRDDQFKCKNNICIGKVLQCDHNPDCLDGSDEFDCKTETSCIDRGEFDCYGDSSFCIAHDKVCDGHNDCQHREDEKSILCKHNNPCNSKKCGNHSHCENIALALDRPVQAVCVCDSGFQLNNSTQLCKDIDECEHKDMCSQICTNTKGGYKCDCLRGYKLERHFFCRAEGDHAWLYFANKRDIRRISPDSRYMEIVVEHTSNSIALDFDVERDIMFWTDGLDEKIYRISNMSNTTKEQHVSSDNVHSTVIANDALGAFAPDGIAVDWLYQNIYWTNTGSNKIMVTDYNGQKSKTLIDSDLDEPRAIVVDPENGYMYWTDWGKKAKIERCGMDGNKRTAIVDDKDVLQWPNGLAIDYISRRIYWIDAKLHKIGWANLNGSDHGYVLIDAREIVRPFSIAVFEDSLYWTDWHTNSILTVHKVTGRSPKRLSMGSYSVMDIKVVHTLKQSKDFQLNATALCRNANCEALCLPTAHVDSNLPKAVTCACADNSTLRLDGRTCEPNLTSDSMRKPTSMSTLTPKASSVLYTTEALTRKETMQDGTPKAFSTSTLSIMADGTTKIVVAHGPSQTATDGHGRIAIIGAIVAFVVIAAAFIVGFILLRQFKARNKKSMNFNNPVYRKTTTTQDCISNDEPQREPLTLYLNV